MDFRVWTYGRMDPRSFQIQAKMSQGEPRDCQFTFKWGPCGHQTEPCWHQIVSSCSKLAPSSLQVGSLMHPWCLPGASPVPPWCIPAPLDLVPRPLGLDFGTNLEPTWANFSPTLSQLPPTSANLVATFANLGAKSANLGPRWH